MAHYRKIDPYIWNDEKFMDLSAAGQLACFYMLTHPHMTAVGGLRGTMSGVASEHPKISEKAFREVFQKGIAKADPKAPLIWFPNFIKYNQPESPNVVVAWAKSLDYLPECETKMAIIQNVKGFLKDFKEAFQKAFTKALPKDFAESGAGAGAGAGTENPPNPPSGSGKKKKLFEPPTEQEVIDYFEANGYPADLARKAFQYYSTANWKDSQGNQVKNWKQKMIAVWFRPENKKRLSGVSRKMQHNLSAAEAFINGDYE